MDQELKAYLDGKFSDTRSNLETYIDGKFSDTRSNLETYIDGKFSDFRSELDRRFSDFRSELDRKFLDVRSEIEATETRLLSEFWKWGRISDQRVRRIEQSDSTIIDRLAVMEDRLFTLERKVAGSKE